MPSPRASYARPSRRARTGAPRRDPARAGTAVTLVLVALLSACSTSTPSRAPAERRATTATPAPADTLLASPTSDGASVVGGLPDGFPTELLPVPADADVLLASAQPADDGLTAVSLNLVSPAPADTLVDGLRGPLLAAGFSEVVATQPDPGLAAQTTFTRSDGAELVVVAVLDKDGRRTLTLGGRVRVAVP